MKKRVLMVLIAIVQSVIVFTVAVPYFWNRATLLGAVGLAVVIVASLFFLALAVLAIWKKDFVL